MRSILIAVLAAALSSGCAAPQERPMDTPSVDEAAAAAATEADLVRVVRARFGDALVGETLAAPSHLIARRQPGRLPPPPRGEPDWRPPEPFALLIRRDGAWLTATASGWRPARDGVSATLDAALADPLFTGSPAASFRCPDYGTDTVLFVSPTTGKRVRTASCPGIVSQVASAALDA